MQSIQLVAVQTVNAAFFNAVLATGTVFPPVNNAEFAFGPYAGGRQLRMDVVFCRHFVLSFKNRCKAFKNLKGNFMIIVASDLKAP